MAATEMGAAEGFVGTVKEGLSLPACLVIMDGFGLASAGEGNAISLARTPVLDELFRTRPVVKLAASGEDVGLPDGQMGNSEVGHLNIGAGRIVNQELTRINRACRDGSIAENTVLKDAFSRIVERRLQGGDSVLHLMGLLSDGGVHSSNEHLYAIVDAALDAGVCDIRIHCFMDGRDVPPKSGCDYMAQLEERMAFAADAHEGASISVSSISGRYFAMDRDSRWDRVQAAYEAIACGSPVSDADPQGVMRASYDEGVTDEFVFPVSLDGRGIMDGDAVVFFNFRPDRAREITRAIVDEGFDGFDRGLRKDVDFVCLTEYDPSIDAAIAFPKAFPENVLADVLAQAGLSQYHIAETEKYAHVTFFLNGGREERKVGEERKLIGSPKVATYDLQPEMSEPEVASALAAAIRANEADVYIVNFANCDMVGHTGVIPAAVSAVEAVDAGVGQVVDAMREMGGVTLITADHGNADCMLAEDGSAHTAHTCAPVPLILVDDSGRARALSSEDGRLADIAPTLLELIGLDIPVEMTGNSLLAN